MRALILLCCLATPVHAGDWHLMTQSYGGTVSLQHGLDKRTCEFAKNRALGLPATDAERTAERAREAVVNPTCPSNDADKETWKRWKAENPFAQGCRHVDGNGATSWSMGQTISAGNIRTAECFQ